MIFRGKTNLSEHDITDIVKAIYLTASGNIQLLFGAVEFCKLILRMEDPSEGYENVLVSKDLILASILHYSECVAARQDSLYQDVHKALGGRQADSLMVLASPATAEETERGVETSSTGDNIFPSPPIPFVRSFLPEWRFSGCFIINYISYCSVSIDHIYN